MLEFVDSDLYFVQDENYFINPLLQLDLDPLKKVEYGFGFDLDPRIRFVEKRIRIRPEIEMKKKTYLYLGTR